MVLISGQPTVANGAFRYPSLQGYFMAQEAQRVTATSTAARAAEGGVAADDTRRWLILGVVCLGQLMVVLDATVVNIALPTAQHDLAFSNADRQWVVTAYSLAFGGLLLLGGRLSDLVGRKRMLIIGMVGFAAPRRSAGPRRTSRCC